MSFRRIALCATFALAPVLCTAATPEDTVRQILDTAGAAGAAGGLVLHLGCGDGSVTAALRADDGT